MLTDLTTAQDIGQTASNKRFLSSPIRIPDPDFKHAFSTLSTTQELKIPSSKKLKTLLKNNKYPIFFSAILSYETIDLIFQSISPSTTNDIYASFFIINIILIALIIKTFLNPESLLNVLPLNQIMDPQNILNSCLVQRDSMTTDIGKEFFLQTRSSRFEWGITIAKNRNKILNLISQGTILAVRHSLWSHLVFASKRISLISSLHTHPFEENPSIQGIFPSPADFKRSNSLEREKNATNYLLAFPDKQLPVLFKYQQSLDGKGLVTHFVFGEKNVIAVLNSIFDGKDFDCIEQENAAAIINHVVEINWKKDYFDHYSIDFSYLPTNNKKLMFLLNFDKTRKQKKSHHTNIPKQKSLAQNSPLIQPFSPFQSLSPYGQYTIDFSL